MYTIPVISQSFRWSNSSNHFNKIEFVYVEYALGSNWEVQTRYGLYCRDVEREWDRRTIAHAPHDLLVAPCAIWYIDSLTTSVLADSVPTEPVSRECDSELCYLSKSLGQIVISWWNVYVVCTNALFWDSCFTFLLHYS